MVSSRVTWDGGLDQMIDGFAELAVRIPENVEGELRGFAGEWADWAKANHEWQNRTGEAEAGLHAIVIKSGGGWIVKLMHGVYYGIFLEYRWGGRYGVLRDSLLAMAPRLQARLGRAILRR